MPRALGYIRRDPVAPETPLGLLEDLVDARASQLGYEMDPDDIRMESDDSTGRPVLEQLLQELPRRGAATVIVPNFATLADNPLDLLRVLSVLDHRGVRLEAVSWEEDPEFPGQPVAFLRSLLERGEI